MSVRIGAIAGVVALLFIGLLTRLWYLQVLNTEDFQSQAQIYVPANTIRYAPIPAPRGRILDAHERVLVDNRRVNVVTVDAAAARKRVAADSSYLLYLAREISRHGRPVKVADLDAAVADLRYSLNDRIPIAYDVREEFAIIVGERSEELPGVRLTETSVRHYPFGPLAAHVLGYVGSITASEAAERENHPKRYQPNDEIGKAGVELAFEDVLRGTPGWRETTISPDGQIVSERQIVAPIAGFDVHLTLDIDIQALVEAQLRAGLERARGTPIDVDPEENPEPENPLLSPATYPAPAGSAVLLDPRDGSVLAMASYPSYDPREFILGIDEEEFAALIDPESYAPFNNRAIAGAYSIGSAMKPFTAYAALSSGLVGDRGYVDVNETINDTGSHILQDCEGQCEFTNARGESYGEIDLRLSLTVSSDVYYYQLAEQFAIRPGFDEEQVQKTAREFGFGSPTGVALPFESSGLIPDSEIKRQRNESNPAAFPDADWRVGDTLNIAIGQGDMAATPLQLANALSVFANGGTLHASNIAKAVKNPVTGETESNYTARVVRNLYMPRQIADPILEGMVGVTEFRSLDYSGTAAAAFAGFPSGWTVAGKTGTVEVLGKNDNSVFMAFGPVGDSRYSMVVIMEEAGFGGRAAAPVVRNVLESIAVGSVPVAEPLADDGFLVAVIDREAAR